MGGVTGLERETAKEGFKRERERWKIERNLAFAESGSYWQAVEMGKCKNYLAAISLPCCGSGLLSVFEDCP